MNSPLAPILAAEDEESDAFLLRYAFQKAGISAPLVLVRDGASAVEYLNGDAPYSDRSKFPLPATMLLDLKMPRMSGFDVLRWIADRPKLRAIPVYVLSSSSAPADMRAASELGARGYFVKPHDLHEYVALIRRLPIARATEA
jgi:CheY-like chemotaxis protein